MTKQTKEDLKIILDYLWIDEQKHYQESPDKSHIYCVLKRLAKKIEYIT
jgi:hypothetical protein